jgi:hypothetical protein
VIFNPLNRGSAALKQTLTNTDSVTLVAGTPVYVSGSGSVQRARANSLLTSFVIGLAAADIASAATGPITAEPFITLTTAQWDAISGETGGLTPGKVYFLSSTTAGRITKTGPTDAANNTKTMIGIAVSTTLLRLNIGEPVRM